MVMEIRIQRPCKAIAKLFPCLYEPQGISIDIRVLGRAEECERYRRFGLLLGLATCREISEHKSGDSEGVHILVCYAVSTGKLLPTFRKLVVHSYSESVCCLLNLEHERSVIFRNVVNFTSRLSAGIPKVPFYCLDFAIAVSKEVK